MAVDSSSACEMLPRVPTHELVRHRKAAKLLLFAAVSIGLLPEAIGSVAGASAQATPARQPSVQKKSARRTQKTKSWAKPTAEQRAFAVSEHARAYAVALAQTTSDEAEGLSRRSKAEHARAHALAFAQTGTVSWKGTTHAPRSADLGGQVATSQSGQAVTKAAKAPIDIFKKTLDEANALRTQYSKEMTQTPTLDDTSLLKSALERLLRCEQDMVRAYNDGSGSIKVAGAELRLFLDVVDTIATVYDDLNEPEGAAQYFERLLEYDRCMLVRSTNATLEYEYCSGRYFSRLVLMYRHQLKRPDLATKTYKKAVERRFNGERVHWWPNEWQIPTLFMRGLRGQPYWDKGAKLALASALEENFAMLREEFLEVLARPEYTDVFTQNDHTLITAGTWGELKLFNGKAWKDPCKDVASKTCAFLSTRPELMGKFPSAKTHNVNLPKEAGYFKLVPGTKLKPHTGPVNFHLYCHLGLVVPKGPRLRVGRGKPRRWQEGKALCFDDSFDHEAWHDGDEARYVLMVTFWHPDLGTPENDVSAPKLPAVASSAKLDHHT